MGLERCRACVGRVRSEQTRTACCSGRPWRSCRTPAARNRADNCWNGGLSLVNGGGDHNYSGRHDAADHRPHRRPGFRCPFPSSGRAETVEHVIGHLLDHLVHEPEVDVNLGGRDHDNPADNDDRGQRDHDNPSPDHHHRRRDNHNSVRYDNHQLRYHDHYGHGDHTEAKHKSVPIVAAGR